MNFFSILSTMSLPSTYMENKLIHTHLFLSLFFWVVLAEQVFRVSGCPFCISDQIVFSLVTYEQCLSARCAYIPEWFHLDSERREVKRSVCQLRFLLWVKQRCFHGACVSALLAVLCKHTHTYISLMVCLSPAEFHVDQTVMRKGITPLHQQLSPAAPVSI